MTSILLTKVKDKQYNEDGKLYSWVMGDKVAYCEDIEHFISFVDENLGELSTMDVQAFSGSARNLQMANRYLDQAIRKYKGICELCGEQETANCNNAGCQ